MPGPPPATFWCWGCRGGGGGGGGGGVSLCQGPLAPPATSADGEEGEGEEGAMVGPLVRGPGNGRSP